MDKQLKLSTALWVLAASLGLGVLADVLFRDAALGLNASLWITTLIVVTCAIAASKPTPLTAPSRGLLAIAILFGACLAWRDSPVLKVLDILAAGVAISLALGATQRLQIAYCGLMDYLLAMWNATAGIMVGGCVILTKYIPWADMLKGERTRSFAPIVRGFMLAAPLLIVFGALLASADRVFGEMITRPLHWKPDAIIDHGTTIVAVAIATAGLIYGFLATPSRKPIADVDFDPAEDTLQPIPPFSSEPQGFLRPGQITATEVGIALSLVAALFGLFVLIQVRYLFGGASLIGISPNLTYAQYARSGFFELVAASALALPVLLFFHHMAANRTVRERLCYSLPAGALVCCLLVVMVSAAFRMRLYTQAYGLTELRLYTNACIGWLGAVFFWFAATVLRGRRENFAVGTVVAAFMLVFSLHVLNPDDYIVKTNQSLANQGVQFDLNYALNLSDDALPALIGWAEVDEVTSDRLHKRADSVRQQYSHAGWRSWSYSRWLAQRASSKAI
jgi:hypothetical protein